MGNFVKWIGAGTGWFVGEWLGAMNGWGVGGPAGSILGFILGTVVDSFELRIFRKSDKPITMGDFATNLLMLIAAVMKADGQIRKKEQDYVKVFLKQNFGEKEAPKAHLMLNTILKQQIPLENACPLILQQLDYSSRLQLTHFLYNLANVDGTVNEAEKNILNYINNTLRVNVSGKRSVGSMFAQEDSDIIAYGILGVHRSASVIDIKKAYRRLAAQCHPDKVAYLGEELKKVANDKFQQLSRAYETIKKDRKFT